MELWIRSQDREQLRKIVDIKYQKGTFEDEDIEVIIGTTQYDEWEVLGQYKTKERALEVLDEIQNIILLKDMYEYDKNSLYESWENIPKEEIQEIRRQLGVYEMPKE